MTSVHIFLLFATLACIAVSLSCIAIGMLNKRMAGRLLLSVGWLHKSGLFFTLFLAVTIFLSNMLVRAIDPEIIGVFEWILSLVCIGLGITYFFRSGLSHLEIRENGIVDFWLYLRWKEIESYEWNGSVITIRFRRGIVFRASWYVPLVYREHFDSTLHQHVFPGLQLTHPEIAV